MKDKPKTYLIFLGGFLTAILTIVTLFNAFIDNHGLVFNLNQRPLSKPVDPSEISVLKRNLIYRRSDYESAVFGTSRALYGFDCSHPFFGGKNAINAGMPGITFQEMGEAVCHFIRNQRAKRILITLDYGSFVQSKDPFHIDFGSNPFRYVGQLTTDLFKTFLSVDTLTQGLKSLGSRECIYDLYGALNNDIVLKRTLKQGDLKKSFKKAEERCAEFWGKSEKQLIDSNLLTKISKEAKDKNVELFWLFTPYHENLISFFKKRDGINSMLEWRREMSRLLLDEEQSHVFAWDTCNHLSLSVDEIIQESGKGVPLFFEMSHFSKRLGNMILERLQQGNQASRDNLDSLVCIQRGNLNAYIQMLAGLWNLQ